MPPLAGLAIPSPTGGNAMPMRMGVPMAAMGVDPHAIATPERLAPALAKEILQTRDATSHERTQHDCGVSLNRAT